VSGPLLHLSDLHFGTEQPAVVQALLAVAHRLAPEAIIVSGDVTQRARRSQFAAARAFFEALPAVPLLIVPGNHDIALFNLAERLLQPYAAFIRAFGRWGAIERTWASPHWQVTTVNTTRRWRHQQGQLSPAQIHRVAAALRRATPEQARLVVVHQPLAAPAANEHGHLLRGPRELALARWAEAGADAVVGGHIHLPYVLPLAGLARPLAVAQAGSAVSRRVRHAAGNSFNVYRHLGYALRAERWDYTAGDFGCVQQTELALERP